MAKINKQKELWESLAKANPRYFIYTDKGRKITESEFRKSGLADYRRLVADDKLFRSRKSILDFGCGLGRLTEFMAKDFEKVIGTDISGEMIRQAKTRLNKYKNIEFVETNGASIPLPAKSIKYVFSYLVFQHQKDRKMVRSAFREIYRVLSPGGLFKVLLRSDKQKDMDRWWSGVDYTPAAIAKIYRPLGFKLVRKKPVDQYAYWLWLKK